jgi:hypothetical protein
MATRLFQSKRQTLPTFESSNRYEIILLRSKTEEDFSMGREEIRVKWEARIQAFHASGEKAIHWCKANQINRRQLYAWIKRLDAAPSSPRVKPATFIPVQVTSDAKSESSSSLRIRIGSAVIEVESGFEPALLRKVVHALEADPSC